ncbi:MAG TPA: undecaprenyl-diphosphatase [Clostridiaceae bacterium]|nr:undecaprenyl-diphosphatase [Clostridiaceae bacterium]
MILLKALIMGIVEGLTEFLPVSSTGHLIMAADLMNFNDSFVPMFEIVIQLGAILAVIYYYRQKILESLKPKNIAPGGWGFKLWFKVFVAFLPAAIIGLLVNDFVEEHLFSSFTVAIALIVGAIMMLMVEKHFTNVRFRNMDSIGAKRSFIVGIAQCMSLFPGMSRSASTIMGGMMVGMSVKAAAEFSFFLAMPTMVAASAYSLVKGYQAMTFVEWTALIIGFVTSFIVALLVVEKFLSYLGKHPLKPFAYYRLAVGIIMIALILFKVVR